VRVISEGSLSVVHKSFNHDLAASTARGFHVVGNDLVQVLLHPMASHSIPPEVAFGRMAASAVLQALAIEIVLKAIAQKVGKPVIKAHNHVKLFAALPTDIQAACRARYQARTEAATVTDKASLLADLDRVLAVSATVFLDWRYLYEADAGLSYKNHEIWLAFEALAEVYDAA
jgi:capsular polysaccharide biosynthesis protein